MENFQPGLLGYRNHDTGIPLTGWICCNVITKQFFLLCLIDVLDLDKSSHPASRIRDQRLRLSERSNTTLDFYGKQLASCRFPFSVDNHRVLYLSPQVDWILDAACCPAKVNIHHDCAIDGFLFSEIALISLPLTLYIRFLLYPSMIKKYSFQSLEFYAT